MLHHHRPTFKENLVAAIYQFAGVASIWFLLAVMIRVFAFIRLSYIHTLPDNGLEFMLQGLKYDMAVLVWLVGYACIPAILLLLIAKRLGNFLLITAAVLILVAVVALEQYFASTLLPLGSDLFAYSLADIKQTLAASNSMQWYAFIPFIIIVPLTVFACLNVSKIKVKWIPAAFIALLVVLKLAIAIPLSPVAKAYPSEVSFYLVNNKLGYFINASLGYLEQQDQFVEEPYYLDSGTEAINSKQIDPNYPFLHQDSTPDVLSDFFAFENDGKAPSIVFIVVESLGKAYSGPNAYLGSFTPFLDSLAEHSLYFHNFLSTAGRTFAVLPSVLASAPFAQQGFLEMGNSMPQHQSLFHLLNQNGYTSQFFYGGDAAFDKMDIFLKQNKVVRVFDKKTFTNKYAQLPKAPNGFSWGYGDKELFKRYFDEMPVSAPEKPHLSVLLTITTHDPFLIPDEAYYNKLFLARMQQLKLDRAQQMEYRKYNKQYASIMYMDDAFRYFFREYAKRPDFKNTIFIITGDHRMPEIPIATQIDRFHVPLIIYSPMLKRKKDIGGVSTQFDITPSVIALLRKQQLQFPATAHWVGTGLDTASSFIATKTAPLMRNKNELVDFLDKDYFYSKEQLFKLSNNMGVDPVNQPETAQQVADNFLLFKEYNDIACMQNKLANQELMQFKPRRVRY